MPNFLSSLSENVEAFFKTPIAALLGTILVALMCAIILFLIKYFENK